MDRLAVIVIAVLLACLTVRQQAVWSDDVRLWREAVVLNRTSPRPAFNLAVLIRQQGRFAEAIAWLVDASRRAEGHRDESRFRDAIRVQFMAMEMTGMRICDSDWLQPYC